MWSADDENSHHHHGAEGTVKVTDSVGEGNGLRTDGNTNENAEDCIETEVKLDEPNNRHARKRMRRNEYIREAGYSSLSFTIDENGSVRCLLPNETESSHVSVGGVQLESGFVGVTGGDRSKPGFAMTIPNYSEVSLSLVDTGSNRYLSRNPNDFVKIYRNKPVSINGTSGRTDGYFATLKQNVLGLKHGVYFPTLPKEIMRIIPYYGQDNLEELEWDMVLQGRKGYLLEKTTGDTVAIRKDEKIILPVLVEDMFNVEPSSGSSNFVTHRNVEETMKNHGAAKRRKTDVQSNYDDIAKRKTQNIGSLLIDDDEGDEPICSPVDEGNFTMLTALERHQRHGHFHIKGLNVNCPQCNRTKGQKTPHMKKRIDRQTYGELKTLAIDYSGSVGKTSIRGKRLALVVICDAIKYAVVKPISLKTEVAEALKEIVLNLRQKYSVDLGDKVTWFIRRDNEPALSAPEMTKVMRSINVADHPAVPHNPEMNSTVERYMRTLFDGVRTNLIGVDKVLWCYCAEYLADVWNRLPHEYPKMPHHSGKSPIEIMESKVGCESSKDASKLRRFGTLVYYKIQVPKGEAEKEKAKKLTEKWHRGVFLGLCPKSSGWLVGAYFKDNRAKEGISWREYSTIDVKFHEKILIADVNWLKPSAPGIFLPYDKLDELHARQNSRPPSATGTNADGAQGLRVVRPSGSGDDSARPLPGMLDEDYIWPEDAEDESPAADHQADGSHVQEGSDESEEGSASSGESDSERPRSRRGKLRKKADPKRKPRTVDRVEGRSKEGGLKRGQRGPDKKKRVRRTKAQIEADRRNLDMFASLLGLSHEPLEDGEKFVEAHVMLSVKQALQSPDAQKWKDAIEKEHARLMLFETWVPATAEDLANAKQVIPIAVILTIKRCGRYKARAVVLGNLDRSGEVETFAPVVSHAANRMLLTAAACDKDFVIPFDLDSAFLNAELERTVLVSLPEIWAEKHAAQVVKLKKALYGLKEAPRAWFRKYFAILTSLGWTPCPEAPGLWRKESKAKPGKYLKMSVYVDDNLICGPDEAELHDELKKILDIAPGQVIPMKESWDAWGNKWQSLDFLGSDVSYSRDARSMHMSMSAYIKKQLLRFKIPSGKRVLSPNYNEATIASGETKEIPDYPARSVVGALQWVATVCRPDIAVPVNVLAKYVSMVPTKAFANAAKKIFRYLDTTHDQGVSYSPAQEKQFEEIYSKLLPEGREVPKVNLFSDASFANCLRTMRSTSGSIIYFRSCPVAWKMARQGVRAYSTAEAEYIACSDTIVLSETNDFMSFFEKIPTRIAETQYGLSPSLDDCVLWVDNQSAISISKSTELKPKSRHYALRYLRVKDFAEHIVFCPTNLMKADALTKLECAVPQRQLLLHHVENPQISVCDENDGNLSSDEETPSFSDFKVVRKKKKSSKVKSTYLAWYR